MTTSLLQHWMAHPEALNRDTLYELRTLVARYPYFQTLHLLYLKNLYLLHDAHFGTELRRSTLYVADRRALFFLIEGDRYKLRAHPAAPTEAAPDEAPAPFGADRTTNLIDAFLAQTPAEHGLMSIPDYSMDYTAYLLRDEVQAAPANQTPPVTVETPSVTVETPPVAVEPQVESSSDSSVEPSSEPSSEAAATPSSEADDEAYFTETLAKIYIKQQRYEKALEIIKRLSLNYPKKNTYFADQIRFLEKLIINAKSK